MNANATDAPHPAPAAAAAVLVKSGQIPAYYLAIIGTKPVGTAGPTYVVVRATATGKALGQPGPVRALPLSLPQNRMLTGFALSADGSKLALGVTQVIDGGKNFGTTSVVVDDLATGQSHAWTGNGLVGNDADGPQALSWTSDGQTLGSSGRAIAGTTRRAGSGCSTQPEAAAT